MNNLITGAFSFSGRYIAEELLKLGEHVETLTGHPNPKNPHYDQIIVKPYNFDDFDALIESFRGIDTFYNSYWIRFPYKGMNWKKAIENCNKLFKACKIAGVKKIVHISVTNCTVDSPYSYFRGKALVEELLKKCGVPYTILRVAWFYEDGDILVNDVAWLLRHLPVFGLFEYGTYKLQPISAKSLAKLAVESRYQGEKTINQNKIINAIGPETYTWKEFVLAINKTMGSKTLIVPFPGFTGIVPIIASTILGMALHDRLLTLEEIKSLEDNLCLTTDQPVGKRSFKKWLRRNSKLIGLEWHNEVKRHYY